MTIQLRGQTSNVADVNSAGHLLAALPAAVADAAPAILAAELDTGSVTGSALRRKAQITDPGRLRAGLDNVLFAETFCHSTFNSSNFLQSAYTMTVGQSPSGCIINSGNSVAVAAYARVVSQRAFQAIGGAPLRVDLRMSHASAPVTNNVCEWGLMAVPGAASAPAEGVFFRLNGAGALVGVLTINSAELLTAALTVPPALEMHDYTIIVYDGRCEFWIDDVLRGALTLPVDGANPGNGTYYQLCFKTYNAAATATAQQLRLHRAVVTAMDVQSRLPPTHQKALAGLSLVQNQPGATVGQLANRADSVAPVSVGLSNVSTSYATLGGQFRFAAVTGAETDYALFAYQLAAIRANVPSRNLVVTGIGLDTYITGAAVGTTATVLEWYAGVGATGVPLSTPDTVSTKSPRRVHLGVQSFVVGDPIGKLANPIGVTFDTPLVVNPAEFFHIILRMPIATATASQIIRGSVRVTGYWE